MIAAPVFAIIAAGLAAGRLGFMGGADAAVLNKFVFRFAMPAALFGLTATTPPPGADYIGLALVYAAAAFASIFGTYLLAQRLFPISEQEAGAHAFAATIGNAVFLGLPIALAVETWARAYIVLMLIEGVAIITIGASLMTPRENGLSLAGRIGKTLRAPLTNPLVIASSSGFAFSALGLTMPESGVQFFQILGAAAGPAALFSLGLFLATNQYPDIRSIAGRAASILVVKLAFLPVLALGGARLFGVDDPTQVSALALFTFMPSGVTSFVMASQYGIYKTETASALLLSTICAIFTVSGVLIAFA